MDRDTGSLLLWLRSITFVPDHRHCLRERLPVALYKKNMKKVLVVFDGEHFPSATLDFALELNSREPIVLTGIFLPSADYADIMSYSYYGNALAPFYPETY